MFGISKGQARTIATLFFVGAATTAAAGIGALVMVGYLVFRGVRAIAGF